MNQAELLRLHARGRSLGHLQDAIHGLRLLHKQSVEAVKKPDPSPAVKLAYEGTKKALADLRGERNHARNALGLNRKGQSLQPPYELMVEPVVAPLVTISPDAGEPTLAEVVPMQLNGYMRPLPLEDAV